MWGLQERLQDVWPHFILRDGETEARVSHDLPGPWRE